MIEHEAYQYAEFYGWRVIPLHGVKDKHVCTCAKNGDCPSAGKHPRINEWQKHATNDPDKAYEMFQRFSDSNIGVALGADSGIIDIECDDEKAEKTLFELFDGELPETPTFQAHRGKHRLFKWTSDLPFQNKNGFKIGNLEFRTGNGSRGAQSVFPPSIHASGMTYSWIIPPDAVDCIEPLPDSVIAKLSAYEVEGDAIFQDANKSQARTGPVTEGSRNTSATSEAGRLLKNIPDISKKMQIRKVWDILKLWNETNCIPPLDEAELKTTFESVLRLETAQQERKKKEEEQRQSEANEKYEQAKERFETEMHEEHLKQAVDEGWRLVEYQSEPVQFHLFSPLWDGFIVLSNEELDSVLKIRRIARAQAGCFLDKSFKSLWDGPKGKEGLLSFLYDNRSKQEACADDIRTYQIATILLPKIAKERENVEKCEEPVSEKLFTSMKDGTVMFQFTSLIRDDMMTSFGVTKNELGRLFNNAEVAEKRVKAGGQYVRYRVVDDNSFQKIIDMATFIPDNKPLEPDENHTKNSAEWSRQPDTA